MSLLNRIKRLVTSDAHAFVEGLEEPKVILAQAIREMESELARDSADLKTRHARLEAIRRKQSRCEEERAALESDIELAIDEKREDLAKPLIRKSIVLKLHEESLTGECTTLNRETETLGKELQDKRKSFDEICTRAEVLQFRCDSGDGVNSSDAFVCAERIVGNETLIEHEVELELLKRMKARAV